MLFVLHAQGIGDLRWFETSTFLKITTCHVLSLLKIILQSLLSSLYRPVCFKCTPHRKKPSAGKGPLGWNMMEPASWNTRCDVSQLTGGEVLLGEVVVWRCPCQCPWDMEVWEAKPWPKAVAVVPEDVVLVSLDGHGTPAWLVGTMTAIWTCFPLTRTYSMWSKLPKIGSASCQWRTWTSKTVHLKEISLESWVGRS